MVRAALSYPSRRPDGPRSVLLGSGLVVLTAVLGVTTTLDGPVGAVALLGVVPWLVLRGYYVHVIRTTIGRDRPTPPALEHGGRLLRDGLTSVFISGVYLLPGLAVIGPLVYARAVGTDLATLYGAVGLPTALANAALSATGVLALFAAMYLIGALYATPVAVARFAHADRIGAAFEARDVIDGALTEDYAVAWAISLGLQVLLFPVAYVLRAALVGFVLHFVVAVAVRYCYGQGVGAGLDLPPAVPDPTGPGAVDPTPGDARTPTSPDQGVDPMSDRARRPDRMGSEMSTPTGRHAGSTDAPSQSSGDRRPRTGADEGERT